MLPELSAVEARVIGCLMEKSVVTPDQYPMTLNALTNACNQKSSREPVMNLGQGEVQRATRSLKEKSLLRIDENYRSGTEKYRQGLCNTTFGDLQLRPAEFAVLCLLLLRGPQTPGELKARSGRLHEFSEVEDVMTALQSLSSGDAEALVRRLPRRAGRRDNEYMHQLCGPVAGASVSPAEIAPAAEPADTPASPQPATASLENRVAQLESEMAELRRKLADLL